MNPFLLCIYTLSTLPKYTYTRKKSTFAVFFAGEYLNNNTLTTFSNVLLFFRQRIHSYSRVFKAPFSQTYTQMHTYSLLHRIYTLIIVLYSKNKKANM